MAHHRDAAVYNSPDRLSHVLAALELYRLRSRLDDAPSVMQGLGHVNGVAHKGKVTDDEGLFGAPSYGFHVGAPCLRRSLVWWSRTPALPYRGCLQPAAWVPRPHPPAGRWRSRRAVIMGIFLPSSFMPAISIIVRLRFNWLPPLPGRPDPRSARASGPSRQSCLTHLAHSSGREAAGQGAITVEGARAASAPGRSSGVPGGDVSAHHRAGDAPGYPGLEMLSRVPLARGRMVGSACSGGTPISRTCRRPRSATRPGYPQLTTAEA